MLKSGLREPNIIPIWLVLLHKSRRGPTHLKTLTLTSLPTIKEIMLGALINMTIKTKIHMRLRHQRRLLDGLLRPTKRLSNWKQKQLLKQRKKQRKKPNSPRPQPLVLLKCIKSIRAIINTIIRAKRMLVDRPTPNLILILDSNHGHREIMPGPTTSTMYPMKTSLKIRPKS